MAYTKQTWQNGDTITAERLNYIEEGIELIIWEVINADKRIYK